MLSVKINRVQEGRFVQKSRLGGSLVVEARVRGASLHACEAGEGAEQTRSQGAVLLGKGPIEKHEKLCT